MDDIESTTDKPAVSLFCPSCSHVIQQPRILPCLHTLCIACIHKHLNGHYKCPVCNEPTNGIKSSQDIDRLPADSLLESVLDMVALHGGKDIQCDICDESEPSSAVSRCMTCALYMCSIHCDGHKTAKHSKGHEVIEISQLRKYPLRNLRRPLYCLDHNEEFLSSYCETCNKPVCKHCCLQNNTHQHITLDQAIHKYNSEVNILLQKAQKMSTSIEQTMSDIDLVVGNINSKVKSIMGEIDVIFDYQINSLLKRKKELRNEVQDVRKVKTQALRDQQEKLKSSLVKLKHACKFTDIALTTSVSHQNASSLVLKGFLSSRLLSFLDRESFLLQPAEDSFLEILFDDTLLHHAIETFGGLETRHVCPPQCIARGAGIQFGFVGETTKFLVFLLDQNGNTLPASKNDVTIDITTHDGRKVDVDMTERIDGTCDVSYRPWSPGPLTITIRVRGEEIRGSPFHVKVTNEMKKSWI